MPVRVFAELTTDGTRWKLTVVHVDVEIPRIFQDALDDTGFLVREFAFGGLAEAVASLAVLWLSQGGNHRAVAARGTFVGVSGLAVAWSLMLPICHSRR